MGAKTWKQIYHGYRPGFLQYEAKHAPKRAPWLLHLIGRIWPNVPKRWLQQKLRDHKIKAKALYKKRVHEAKKNPVAFKNKYSHVYTGKAADEILKIYLENQAKK